jgi:2-keto-4-pentenoate hydratase/2-oxohepta-3-ene-1,7-dioic acid hydratase in catechol pathway
VKIARYSFQGNIDFGLVEGLNADGSIGADTVVAQADGHPYEAFGLTGVRHNIDQVRLLAPVIPSKIVAIGKNYADHAAEMGGAPPAEPLMFLKPSTSVVGPDDPIVLPWQSEHVDEEAELAVVIGRITRRVLAADAHDYVLGYTCANDVSARDIQKADGQWTRAKGFDTFCPIGPWIAAGIDASDLEISGFIDDDRVQHARTSDLIHSIGKIIETVSGVMTLLPGDVILTGTPAGVSTLRPGNTVRVSIEGIGTLSNPVVDVAGSAS